MNEDIENILPNLVYCLKTGRYTDTDFNEEVAQWCKEYGTSKEVLRMAAVRCCFNCKKTDILRDLISCHKYQIDELERMDYSGISRDISYGLDEYQDFLYNNRDLPFFRYCNDYLTSWDACSLVYKNDFPPSLLAQYACEVKQEEDVLKQAEEIRPAVLASIGKIQWKYDGKKLNYCAISACITTNSTRKDVRDFLKENNYDFDLAQKKFNWIRQDKYFYKKSVKEDNHIKMVRKYPVLVGIPLIVKPSESPSYFKFIDFNKEGQDSNKLVKKALDIQKKAIFQYERNMLNQSSIEILNEEIAECYDMLLYLYISGKSSIIDYNNKKWKAKYKDKITDKLNELIGEVEETSVWLFKDIISTMFFSNNIGKCLYKINGWTDLLINNNDNISISLINRGKEI